MVEGKNWSNATEEECFAEAQARIAHEQVARIGELDLSDFTRLAVLPIEITQLQHLLKVDIRWTQVYDLALLADLCTLQSLNCGISELDDLTPLANLRALQSLNCSSSEVYDLAPLAKLNVLHLLDCSATYVQDLAPLANLSGLQYLDCDNTLVHDLTPLVPLVMLKRLRIDYCIIAKWFISLIWQPAMQYLYAYSTQLATIPPEVLSQDRNDNCLPRLRAHLCDLEAGTAPVSNAKLMLLGNGTVGKTQLCRRLVGLPFDITIPSTHGVKVQSLPTAGGQGEWHIWDFGGQDIYHSTHALFMRTRAVFVLVWSPASEQAGTHQTGDMTFRNHPLEYWVQYVRHTAGSDCPLLIVQTRCEQPQDEARQLPLPAGLLDDFKWCKVLQYSSQNNRGRAALDEALADAHAWLLAQHPATIGQGRLRVQRALCAWRDADNPLPKAEKCHRLVTQAEFTDLCAQGAEGVSDVSDAAALLDYLHHAGIVFYRQNLFGQQIILDQGWALDAIYTVFEREKCWLPLRRLRGRFNRTLLANLIWTQHSKAEQELFLSMMCSCGVAFVHIEGDEEKNIETEYIAPDLLPPKADIMAELEEKWDDASPSHSAEVAYTLHQPGLLRGLVAKIGSIAGINGLYWQGGVCVYEQTTRSRALIEQTTDAGAQAWHGQISIRTQGTQAAQLLAALKEQLERETRDWRIHIKPDSAPAPQPPQPAPPLVFAAEPTTTVQYGVSYGRTPESAALVDQLCADATERGIRILRDETAIGIGERISGFMQRLAAQDRIFIILSEKYLKSPLLHVRAIPNLAQLP